jgi:hypothetical protein
MRPIDIAGFLGQNTSIDPLGLPAGVGAASLNQQPGYGDLRPWRGLGGAVASVASSPQQQTIYRFSRGAANTGLYWFSWSTVVNAVPGFDADDTTERTYFTGSSTPKWTNNVIGLSGGPPYPQATRELGVPAPTGAITGAVNTAGPAGPEEEAFQWVYTYVNDLGWESAPSPVSNTLLQRPGTTFDLSGFSAPPSGNYGINKVRLYRFVTGADTVGAYFFLREWAIGSEPANPIDDARAVGSDPLATTGWRPCPGIPNGGASNLTEATAFGMTRLWNGMLAVLTGKSMRMCEPYAPYAWPLAYEVTVTDDPVAIGVYSQRALILTKGDAVLAAGSSPDSMDDEAVKINRPCSSARGVVSFNEGMTSRGVVWPSEEGLCWYGDGGFKLLTDKIVEPAEWRSYQPATMRAGRSGTSYVCFYTTAGGEKRGFTVDMRDVTNPGFYPLATGYDALFLDPSTDRLFVLEGDSIKEWNAGAALTATFRSKDFRMPAPMNIGAVEVIARTYPATVRLYYDGVLHWSGTATSDEPLRPRGDTLPDQIACQVETAGRVIAVRLARSPKDLKQV